MYIYETGNENYSVLETFAKENRKNPTEAESIIWDLIRNNQLGIKFRRQHVIDDYIADFVSLHYKLIIEIDGGYHFSNNQIVKDKERTEELLNKGFTIIRFTNDEVINSPNAILEAIKQETMEIIKKKEVPSSTPDLSQESVGKSLPSEGFREAPPSSGRFGGLDAWAVDAACSGNPGPMEYQAIDLATGARVFHFGPLHGTNNIGEFLAIVHALALCWQQGQHQKTIYSDSYNAILWVKKRKCKTTLERTPQTEKLFEIIERAERWLQTHDYHNPIVKWETAQWGEIPADFGRK